jgi:UDP-N-acetylmuramoylalanine--D-glutamate ligase
MMNSWNGKHLVILGAARQGLALAKYLVSHGADVTITDQKDEKDLMMIKEIFRDNRIKWALGGHPLDLLDHADGVAVSGGVPLEIPFIKEALRRPRPYWSAKWWHLLVEKKAVG